MIGDAGIYWPVYNSLKHHFEKLKIYFYHFAYEGTFSILGSVNHPHGKKISQINNKERINNFFFIFILKNKII